MSFVLGLFLSYNLYFDGIVLDDKSQETLIPKAYSRLMLYDVINENPSCKMEFYNNPVKRRMDWNEGHYDMETWVLCFQYTSWDILSEPTWYAYNLNDIPDRNW